MHLSFVGVWHRLNLCEGPNLLNKGNLEGYLDFVRLLALLLSSAVSFLLFHSLSFLSSTWYFDVTQLEASVAL